MNPNKVLSSAAAAVSVVTVLLLGSGSSASGLALATEARSTAATSSGTRVLAQIGTTFEPRWSPYHSDAYFKTSADGWMHPYLDFWEWADPENEQLGVDLKGRVVVADGIYGSKLRVSLYDQVTWARLLRGTIDTAPFQASAFWVGPDGNYYVLMGRSQEEQEDDNFKVLAVRKYDQHLHLLASTLVPSGFAQISGATALGESSFAMAGNILFVNTSQYLYRSLDPSNFQHHESNLSFAIDVSTMKLLPDRLNYASHSFNQFVRTTGSKVVLADHGDAYPRALQLSVLSGDFSQPDSTTGKDLEVLKFPGQTGDNVTGATVSGMELGSNTALNIGLSAPNNHPLYGVYGRDHVSANAYLVTTNLTTGNHTYRWLTTYHPKARPWTRVGEPRLVKLSSTRFVALYDVTTRDGGVKLHYVLLDSAGRTITRKIFTGGFAAVSDVVRTGTKLVWAADIPGSPSARTVLFGISVKDPLAPVLIRR